MINALLFLFGPEMDAEIVALRKNVARAMPARSDRRVRGSTTRGQHSSLWL